MSDPARQGAPAREPLLVPDGEQAVGRRIETEATLVVVTDPPEEVTDVVAALSELAGFALLRAPDQSIRDRYFDSPDGKLRAARTGLRLREVGQSRLLTLKGPATPASHAGMTRTELEEVWPDRAWTLLRGELGELLDVPAVPPASDPVRALEALGLVPIQDRTTFRRVRSILSRTGARERLAELALDAVIFDLDGRAVRHDELEIEVKAEGGDAALAVLAESLAGRFTPGLRPWPFGKLSTGMAIARLIEEHGADAVLTAGGRVRPSAYDAIADLLAGDRAGAGQSDVVGQSDAVG